MVIYIYGEDTFRSRHYLKDQVVKFKAARDPQGYNVVILDCAKAEAGKVLGEISVSPFLAEKRMVVLENVLSNNDKELLGELVERAQASATPPRPPLERGGGVRPFPESNIIVFYQAEPHSKIKEVKELHELLRKEKYAKEFEALAGAPLIAWINTEIKNRGGKISSAAAQYLAANVGGDIWQLNTLIDQLVAYSHSPLPPLGQRGTPSPSFQEGVPPQAGRELPEIQLADAQLFLDEKIDDNTFALTDAIVAGNHKLAFKLLNGQRALGAEDQQIFGAILWQFRVLMSMRDLYERQDMRSDEMAKVLKLHPFVVKKNLAIVKKYSVDKLKKVYTDLLDIDIKTKTGFAEQEMLMDLFVGKI